MQWFNLLHKLQSLSGKGAAEVLCSDCAGEQKRESAGGCSFGNQSVESVGQHALPAGQTAPQSFKTKIGRRDILFQQQHADLTWSRLRMCLVMQWAATSTNVYRVTTWVKMVANLGCSCEWNKGQLVWLTDVFGQRQYGLSRQPFSTLGGQFHDCWFISHKTRHGSRMS